MHEQSRSMRHADSAADPADGTAVTDDRHLVALLAAGGVPEMAAVYDRYADRLLDYAAGVLGDRHAAADAVHDALLIAAQRIGQLRDPARLRSWLYAITRRESLRALRHRARHTELAAAEHIADDTVDPAAAPRAAELRELVWAAANGLNPTDREVIELTVRHGLDGAQLAATLGVSRNQAHAMASRARAQFERALAVVVVARTGRDHCARLAGLLTPWDGTLTPLWRKRIARHVDGCGRCGQTQRRNGGSASLLAAVPFLVAPAALRARLVADISAADAVAHKTRLSRRAGRFGRDGFPRYGRRLRAPVITPFAAAILFALLLAAGAHHGTQLIDRIGSPITMLTPLFAGADPTEPRVSDHPVGVGRSGTGNRDRVPDSPGGSQHVNSPLLVNGDPSGAGHRDLAAGPGGTPAPVGGTAQSSGTAQGGGAAGPHTDSGTPRNLIGLGPESAAAIAAATGNGAVPRSGSPGSGAPSHSTAPGNDIPPGPTQLNPAPHDSLAATHHDQAHVGVRDDPGVAGVAVAAVAGPPSASTNRHADMGPFQTHPGGSATRRR